MTRRQIRKLARDTYKAGPVIVHDENGNGYFGFAIFVREGMKYTIVVCDEDIVNLNEPIEFLSKEIEWALEDMKNQPLSTTSITDVEHGIEP